MEVVVYTDFVDVGGLGALLPLFGPQLRHLDSVVRNYRWPQWHHQLLQGGALSDYMLSSDPGFFIKCSTLDAGRAEAVAQAQLGVLTQALNTYDAELDFDTSKKRIPNLIGFPSP